MLWIPSCARTMRLAITNRACKSPKMELSVHPETFPLAETFAISRGAKTEAHVVRVNVRAGEIQGHGECVPYARYDETPESVIEQIQALPENFSREELQTLMPAGAARNAVDCALWDLEAKQTGKPVWRLAGLDEPEPVTTAYTLSLDTPDKMKLNARKNADRPLLKLKLGTPDDVERLEAVREGAPKSTIILDANEGWQIADLLSLKPHLKRLEVALVEQPFPEGADAELDRCDIGVPICADESCHTSDGLSELSGKYDYINIKLDKTGGLTEALKMKNAATEAGFGIFIGCMVGTSLGMAPAMLLAQGADFVDLDGPLLLAQDRSNGLRYEGSIVHPSTPKLWG